MIIGASAAGLATAACLKRLGHEHVLLERSTSVGASWRGHYDRLHLHTNKGASHLPFVPFGRSVPRYPSRTEVVDYLQGYVDAVGLSPRYDQAVTRVHRVDDAWITRTGTATYRSRDVVVATGMTRTPFVPTWPGQADYTGEVLHSSAYRNGQPWFGQRVLVVGFGNSAGEVALDLHEHGARPTLAVRSAVNVIPRELLGIPILLIASVLNLLPPRVADALGAPFSRLSVGDVGALGLRRLPYGPMEQTRRDRHVPLIDIGTIAAIRAGHVALRGDVAGLTPAGVRFADGTEEEYDAIVAATGFRAAVTEFLDSPSALDADGLPRRSGHEVTSGLYFCGFYVSPIGMLRQIGIEARQIARAIHRSPTT